jgi:glycerol-3-phosphate dehydrogenase
MAVISGPSFAREVAQRMPTSVTVACQNPEIAARVQHVFATAYFRVYTSDDVVGVEMPICHEIYRILYEDLAPKEAVYRLMTRTLKQELDEE